MATFILLSKVSLSTAGPTQQLGQIDDLFERELAGKCPSVRRVASYALLGPYDFMHVIEAPDAKAAAKVALLVNRFGAATTQTLTAIPFEEFKEIAADIDQIQIA